ncbi:MAG: DinB family protein [Bdellovibrionales bacterium]|nr:DinB family protein [Bdellovibrionales bacterium]
MNYKSTILTQMKLTDLLVQAYLGDLTESEFLKRPGGKANHCAWQLGHLISSEAQMMEYVKPGVSPKLPDGFSEKHSKDSSSLNDASAFLKKEEYLKYFAAQREATRSILEGLTDDDLKREAPDYLRALTPTVGEMMVLIASHPLMHAGQWVVLRRELGKPVQI